ncbi:MAG: hypothetical protein JSS02_20825 [Planctomycetes bacterium]|nr:hypothetical protein [Planctomycetota bacterium]
MLMSLGVFLGILAIISPYSGWFALRGYRQLAAIQAIEKRGGFVLQVPLGPPWLRDFLGEDRMRMFDKIFHVTVYENDSLQHLNGLTNLESLSLYGSEVTDTGMMHLRGLTTLKSLSVNCTQVTDAGMRHLRGLTALKSLSVNDTQVTDDGLQHLRDLTALENLSIEEPFDYGLTVLQDLPRDVSHETDAGLPVLHPDLKLNRPHLSATRVTNIEGLSLRELTTLASGWYDDTQLPAYVPLSAIAVKPSHIEYAFTNDYVTRITDAGLQHLRGLTSLRSLTLEHTHVTEGGIADLQQALPKLLISQDPGYVPFAPSDN